MVSQVSQESRKGKLHPCPQGWALVTGPNAFSPMALFLGQAKRNREHWFDELPRTAFLIFKGKVDLNMAAGDEWRFPVTTDKHLKNMSRGCVCVCMRNVYVCKRDSVITPAGK